MNTRNPISCLQEYLAGKHMPLPVYIDEGFGTNFTCTCLAQGIKAVGHSSNKKSAKQEAAKKALEILTNSVNLISTVVENRTTWTSTNITINQQQQEQHFRNYVGELNEHSSKYGMSYPKYNSLTCFNSNGQFVFQCEYLGHLCKGMASNKKDAKQESAKAMLELIKSLEAPTLLEQYKKTAVVRKEIHVENKDEIIHLFQSLSTTPNNKCQITRESIMHADHSIQIPLSLELMKEELRNQGIQYKIKDVPAKNDLFAVSLIVKDTDFTLYGIGKTKHDAIQDAIHSVLVIKKSGCLISTKSLVS